MSYAGSGGDDQSEDGELRHSPTDIKTRQEEILDFSLSEEDADTADSLDIKPPQASSRLPRGTGRSKRRERREGRSRHSRGERHREDRNHAHREKHHRDRNRERVRTEYHREYHKDLYRYTEAHVANATQLVGKYIETQYRRQDELVVPTQSVRYERKYDEKKERHEKHERYEKELRHQQEQEKSRRYEEKDRRLKSVADQTLDDLRERLLDKKRLKDASEDFTKHHISEKETRRRLRAAEHLEVSSVEQDAEMYVKEIIDLSGVTEDRKERHHKREDREKMEVKDLLDPESEEQILRKEKLLQAEREIARQKEQYKLDRERRHQRRQERQEAKRKLQEEQLKEEKRKRQRMSGELGQYKDKDLSIVTVSDASSHSSRSRSVSPASRNSKVSSSDRSTSSEEENEELERSEAESSSPDEKQNPELSGRREEDSDISDEEIGARRRIEELDKFKDSPESVQLAKSDRSTSRSRSKSLSPKSNGQFAQKSEKEPEQKPKSPEPKKLDDDLPAYFPAIQGCRSVEEFQCLNRIEEGTYGVVYRARDKRTDEIVALKRLKMEKEKEGFPITSLREINTLLKGQHPNIVTVREIVVGSNMDKIFIVMDYVEHDLKSLMETMRNRRQVFVPGEVKCLLRQLLGAVAHLHDNWILHRDLKTSNLLLSHKGILKVGDFGLAREYGSPLKAYTPIVVTLWYRAPELLLCAKEYSTPVDMWSVGCIFAELLLMNALFPGKSEVDQLNRIFKELGTPNDRIWPTWSSLPAVKKMKFTEFPGSSLPQKFSMLSEGGLALLRRLLTYDPAQRSTAEDAMRHAWFTEAPLPIDPAMFPTWPAKSELGHRKAMAASPKPPSGGKEYKQLGDADEDSALGFHMGGTSAGASLLEARRLAMGAGFSLKF